MKSGLVSRGISFGPVMVASGALNNFGEGYPSHNFIKMLMRGRFDFTGATLVSKTATLASRIGNLPLDEDYQPTEMFPKCIYVNPFKGIAVNAVSLSNPGIKTLLNQRRWQNLDQNHWISFMAADGNTLQLRLDETEGFAQILKKHKWDFKAIFGVQLNISCPNTDHDPSELAREALEQGRILRTILGDVPLDLKINAMTPIVAVKEIERNNIFDSLTCSNTIPWGKMPEQIDWRKLFGSDVSPLRKRGFQQDGGLSGWPLLPIVESWVKEARSAGIKMPITAGGGILYPDDVDRLYHADVNAIAIGSVSFLKPWNVQPIIQRAQKLFGR
ncbi:MAG: Dihydroorotate dehydrogenase [Candidatus Moranbacteria bacterium GW2011_GWC2_37_73]|nr:MAG: Dihydroorotate dehydrogenase [Parcubacteria group bacterium GW2011_GWC1_36_108]KKQ29991.1 MAG: Dihydroorotate dehydrogenase [Candidatus Moranbacteria bacterium GW2011_GWE1_37_24]KKQ39079.1 MAG: Dihydroorotate dehydrogenase [Candidatus Moranbacteria bacterium GW2011_GWC2_37_73]